MRIILLFLTLFLGSSFSVVRAQSEQSVTPEAQKSFRQLIDIAAPNIIVPTVVQVPVPDVYLERRDIAVYDRTSSIFVPSIFLEKAEQTLVPLSIDSSVRSASNMIDHQTKTYAEFLLPESGQGEARITISSEKPVTSSMLSVLLDAYVALPTSIEIRAVVNGAEQILLAKSTMDRQTVYFPSTVSSSWIITLTYGQPLRISELQLEQAHVGSVRTRFVRFLAQPSHEYRMYFDPDRASTVTTGESSNLSDDKGVLSLPAASASNNSVYVVADNDEDSVPDMRDNCVQVANTDQADVDGNGRGDACDDFDRDGVINSKDNCQNDPNRNQADIDADGIGDVCDTEESRITERNPWLPWAGMGFAAVVLVLLMVSAMKSKPKSL